MRIEISVLHSGVHRGKANGATALGIQSGRGIKRVKLQKLDFIKLLKTYVFGNLSLLTHAA